MRGELFDFLKEIVVCLNESCNGFHWRDQLLYSMIDFLLRDGHHDCSDKVIDQHVLHRGIKLKERVEECSQFLTHAFTHGITCHELLQRKLAEKVVVCHTLPFNWISKLYPKGVERVDVGEVPLEPL